MTINSKLKTQIPSLVNSNDDIQVYGTNIISDDSRSISVPISNPTLPVTNISKINSTYDTSIVEDLESLDQQVDGFELPTLPPLDTSVAVGALPNIPIPSIPTINPTKLNLVPPGPIAVETALNLVNNQSVDLSTITSEIELLQFQRILAQTMPVLTGVIALAVAVKTLSNIVSKLPGGSGISLPSLDIFSKSMLANHTQYVDGADISDGIAELCKWHTNIIYETGIYNDFRLTNDNSVDANIINSITLESVFEKHINGVIVDQRRGGVQRIDDSNLKNRYPTAIIEHNGFQYKLPDGATIASGIGSSEKYIYYIEITFPLGVSYCKLESFYSDTDLHKIEAHTTSIRNGYVSTTLLNSANQLTRVTGNKNIIELASSYALDISVLKTIIEDLEIPGDLLSTIYTGRSLSTVEELNKITKLRIYPPLNTIASSLGNAINPVDYYGVTYGYFDSLEPKNKQLWQIVLMTTDISQEQISVDLDLLRKNEEIESPELSSAWQDTSQATPIFYIKYLMRYKYDGSELTTQALLDLVRTLIETDSTRNRSIITINPIDG